MVDPLQEENRRSLPSPPCNRRQKEVRDHLRGFPLTPVSRNSGRFQALERKLARAREWRRTCRSGKLEMGSEEAGTSFVPDVDTARSAQDVAVSRATRAMTRTSIRCARSAPAATRRAVFAGRPVPPVRGVTRDTCFTVEALSEIPASTRLPADHHPASRADVRILPRFKVRIGRAPRCSRVPDNAAQMDAIHTFRPSPRDLPAARRIRGALPQSR